MIGNEKVKIVYFASLLEDKWEGIVLEQLWSLKNSKIYDDADEIYISLQCNDQQLKRIKQHLWSKFKKIQIFNRVEKNMYEYPGIKSVYDLSQKEDSIILYFHTKGMFSNVKYPERNILRGQLFKYTIENYEEYLNEFLKNKTLDIGGIFPSEFGFIWYNFFWIRSRYVKEHLTPPEPTSHRYYWERWIGKENSTKKDILTYSPVLKFQKLGNKAQLYNVRNKFFNS
jgi:hypothetical protein